MPDRTEWKPMKNQENDRGALWKVTLALPQNRTLNRFDFFVSFLSAAFSVFFYSVYFCISFCVFYFHSSQSISSSLFITQFIVNDFFCVFTFIRYTVWIVSFLSDFLWFFGNYRFVCLQHKSNIDTVETKQNQTTKVRIKCD